MRVVNLVEMIAAGGIFLLQLPSPTANSLCLGSSEVIDVDCGCFEV